MSSKIVGVKEVWFQTLFLQLYGRYSQYCSSRSKESAITAGPISLHFTEQSISCLSITELKTLSAQWHCALNVFITSCNYIVTTVENKITK